MCGIAGQFLKASQAVGFGVEGGLQTPNRRRAVLHHLPSPAHPLRFELFEGHHGIHQSHLQGVLGAIAPTQKPNFPGFALTDHAGQITSTKPPIKTSNLWAGLAKNGVVGRQAEIAQQMKHLSTTHGIPRHQGDHHLGKAANDPLQIQDVQPWKAIVTDITTIATHALVTASAKGVGTVLRRANPCEQHHTDGPVIADAGERITELIHRLRAKGIALGGAIDRDPGNPFRGAVHQDVLVGAPRLPFGQRRPG